MYKVYNGNTVEIKHSWRDLLEQGCIIAAFMLAGIITMIVGLPLLLMKKASLDDLMAAPLIVLCGMIVIPILPFVMIYAIFDKWRRGGVEIN